MSVHYLGDNGPDGVVMGTGATEKIAFHGGTPAVQRSSAAMVALTLTTVSTTAGRGFNTSAAFEALINQVEEIRATLVAYGLHSGS